MADTDEVTLATLNLKMDRNAEEHKRIFSKFNDIDTSLRGNGRPGVSQRLASLEEFKRGAAWATRAMFTTSAALVAKLLHDVFSGV